MRSVEEQEVYKVVQHYDNRITSAWVSREVKSCVEYRLKRWVVAPGNTLLFAFENVDTAIVFATAISNAEVYRARARNPVRLVRCVDVSHWPDEDELIAFWTDLRQNQFLFGYGYPPDATLGCEAIMLVERVRQWNK